MMTSSTHYVLVHGAGHGAWCWYKLRTLLEMAGHTVTCVDLNSAGLDPTNPDTLLNFDYYNQPLLHFLSYLSHHQKVILVGHSLGGYNVTHALYKFPNKILAAVYVVAPMAKIVTTYSTSLNVSWTHSHCTRMELAISGEKSSDTSSDRIEWKYGLGLDKAPTSMILKKEHHRQFFYNMSPLEDCTLAGMLLKPSPVVAVQDFKLQVDDYSEMEKVPRVYIKTLHDNLMSQESQDEMIKDCPPSDVMTIASDHCPFFSNPTHLFNLLVQISSNYT